MDKKIEENVLKLMAGMGNVSYLWGHVEHFEKAIPAEIARFIDELSGCINVENYAYQECHNYSAWIRLYAELICNKAMIKLSHNELCKKAPA